MGWEVIALGSVDFKKSASIEQIHKFYKKVKKLKLVIKCELKWDFINIEMSGNKVIDYNPLLKLIKKNFDIIKGEVIMLEYSEIGEGLYYDPTENKSC